MTIRTNLKAGGISLNHNETLRGGLSLRTGVKAGGLSRNHNETMRGGRPLETSAKPRRVTRGALAFVAGLVASVCAATSAHAGPTGFLSFTCDLNGQPAQLAMQFEAVLHGGVVPSPGGDLRVLPGQGVSYYFAGTLRSATGRYSFTGKNEFADFVDLLTNDRFRVRFIARGQQLLMIINPEGPGPAQHLCQLSGGYR